MNQKLFRKYLDEYLRKAIKHAAEHGCNEAFWQLNNNPPSPWFSRHPTEKMEAWTVVKLAFDAARLNTGKLKDASETARIAHATELANQMMTRRATTDDILKRF